MRMTLDKAQKAENRLKSPHQCVAWRYLEEDMITDLIKEYMTVTQAARQLGMTRDGVIKHITRGNLAAVKLADVYAILRADVLALNERRARRSNELRKTKRPRR